MKNILQRLLTKRGLNSVEELDQEEKQTFQQWQATLTKDELTTEDIRQFIQGQISVIEAKWSDLNVEQARKAELLPYHTVYRMLLQAINSPALARDALEKNLAQLIK